MDECSTSGGVTVPGWRIIKNGLRRAHVQLAQMVFSIASRPDIKTGIEQCCLLTNAMPEMNTRDSLAYFFANKKP